jgi:hypothetical protein
MKKGESKFGITRDLLYEVYVVQKLPIKQIADSLGCDRSLIAFWARTFGFPKRNKAPRNRIAGEQIGDWLLLAYEIVSKRGYWLCKCKCGKEKKICVASLNKGGSGSCRDCAMAKTRDERLVPSHYWLKLTFHAAKRKHEIEITHEYAESLLEQQKHKCAITGWAIGFGRGRTKDGKHSVGETTASLDRIDSNKDYTDGNVQWVHKDINRMKQSFTEERLLVLCEAVFKYAKEGNHARSAKVSQQQDS